MRGDNAYALCTVQKVKMGLTNFTVTKCIAGSLGWSAMMAEGGVPASSISPDLFQEVQQPLT
jgi:hypothetical protein